MGKPQINKVYLTVGNWIQQSIGVYYGFFKSGKEIYGSVSVIPKWGDTEASFYRIGIIKFYQHFGSTKYSYSVCVPSSDSVTQITMSTESGSVTLEKAPNLDFIEYVYNGDYDVLNFIGSLGKTIEVTFDPDGYLEPELQPSLRHPRVLRRTQQRDGLLLDFSRWNQKAEWCFRRTRRCSRNAYLQTKHHCFYLYRQLQRGLHSYPTTGYHSIRGVLQTSLNIHNIQRCSGSLLASYRRASYAE